MRLKTLMLVFGAGFTTALTPVTASAQSTYTIDVNDPKWAHSDNSTNWKLKKKFCKEGNFYKMGFNRALVGKKRDRGLEKIQKKCKKSGVPIDEAAYFAGWEKGIISHCSFKRGYYSARNSSTGVIITVCLPETDYPAYHEGFEIGQEHSDVYQEVKSLKASRKIFSQKIKALENDIRNGTDNVPVPGDKFDTLRLWERDLAKMGAEILDLTSQNNDIFKPKTWMEVDYPEDYPKHWRDIKN